MTRFSPAGIGIVVVAGLGLLSIIYSLSTIASQLLVGNSLTEIWFEGVILVVVGLGLLYGSYSMVTSDISSNGRVETPASACLTCL